MSAKMFLTATVCHLTVTVLIGGDARVTRESGKTLWTGSLRESRDGLSLLVPGEYGYGPSLSDCVRPEMARALEHALDAAYDAKFGEHKFARASQILSRPSATWTERRAQIDAALAV